MSKLIFSVVHIRASFCLLYFVSFAFDNRCTLWVTWILWDYATTKLNLCRFQFISIICVIYDCWLSRDQSAFFDIYLFCYLQKAIRKLKISFSCSCLYLSILRCENSSEVDWYHKVSYIQVEQSFNSRKINIYFNIHSDFIRIVYSITLNGMHWYWTCELLWIAWNI